MWGGDGGREGERGSETVLGINTSQSRVLPLSLCSKYSIIPRYINFWTNTDNVMNTG